MTSKISDREYVLRMLEEMEGKTNQVKARAISRLLGGRITQRLRERWILVNQVARTPPANGQSSGNS
jgi:hypothetical protein